MTVLRLLRISLNVGDLRRAIAFYRDALGFAVAAEQDANPDWARLIAGTEARCRTARLRLGRQELELVAWDPPGTKYPPDSTAADLWFQHVAIVTNDIEAAYQRLQQHGMTPITRGGPQNLPPAAGAVVAYKFRDPDMHPLELIYFPPGAGDPAWQSAAGGPTIGIDHSALSVSNAEHSLAFYGRLGLGVRSRQINSGPEQDRLDRLSNVALDVIGLSPATSITPHVELLCYQAPRGRAFDPNRSGRDIAASRLIFQVEDAGVLQASGVSAEAKEEPGALILDPDGHAIMLLEIPHQ